MSSATHAGNDLHFKGGVFHRHHEDSDKIIIIMDPSGPVKGTVCTLNTAGALHFQQAVSLAIKCLKSIFSQIMASMMYCMNKGNISILRGPFFAVSKHLLVPQSILVPYQPIKPNESVVFCIFVQETWVEK